jgi:hypothetical protein
LIAGLELGERYFHSHPLSRRQLSVLFAAWSVLCAVWTIPLWGRWWVFVATLLVSALFAWASVGTALEWPGFRPEPEFDEDDEGDGAGAADAFHEPGFR